MGPETVPAGLEPVVIREEEVAQRRKIAETVETHKIHHREHSAA